MSAVADQSTETMHSPLPHHLSIAIPTFGRDQVLIDTLNSLLSLEQGAEELIVVDQTPKHDQQTEERLQSWDKEGQIRWIRRSQPSITAAMNDALQQASTNLVLFLDDDIRPYPALVSAHRQCHVEHPDIWASVGQVIQPWQQPESIARSRSETGLRQDFDFPFHSNEPAFVANVMAGNLCVRRDRALQLGGFDENFVGVAYRFETDFARRIHSAGGTIRFCPTARIDHLRVERGGTRSGGSHLTSADPSHGVGDYYFALRHGQGVACGSYIARRMFREVCTKFHLTHPWWIPVKLVGEVRALFWAGRLQSAGPKWIHR